MDQPVCAIASKAEDITPAPEGRNNGSPGRKPWVSAKPDSGPAGNSDLTLRAQALQ
ncbi:MAG TPA: hypothetical protein VNZ03_09185 [Terriglobales bacterium]|nr:hypothetical protein [Terriglobales bacterium]